MVDAIALSGATRLAQKPVAAERVEKVDTRQRASARTPEDIVEVSQAAREAQHTEALTQLPPSEQLAEFQRRLDELAGQVVGLSTRLRIETHDATGAFVYQAIDKKSGQVEAQFPFENALEVAKFLRDLEQRALKPTHLASE